MAILRLVILLLLHAISVWLAGEFLSGVAIDTFSIAIYTAIGIWFVNRFVRPIFKFLTFPISILTLGIFYLFINSLMLMLVDHFVDGFAIANIWWALLMGVVLSLLNGFFTGIVDRHIK